MKYISVIPQNESISKSINVDDIAYIQNSYIYFLTNRDMRVRATLDDLATVLNSIDVPWVGWNEDPTLSVFLHLEASGEDIIVIPGSIKDIFKNQIRFKNGIVIRVIETFDTILSLIPPDTSGGGGGGGEYYGSQYISISSDNVISARVEEMSDTQSDGLVTNTDVRNYVDQEISNIDIGNTQVTVSGNVFNGYSNPQTASALGLNTTFSSTTTPNTKYKLTTDTIVKVSGTTQVSSITGSTSVTGVTGSTQVTGVDPVNTTSVTGVTGSTSVTGVTGSTSVTGVTGSTSVTGVDPVNTTSVTGVTGSTSAVNTSAGYSSDVVTEQFNGTIYGTYNSSTENLTIGYNNGNNISGTATRTAFSTVTVPIADLTATTVPIADSTATTIPVSGSPITVPTAGSSITVVTGIISDANGELAGSLLSTTTALSSADTVTVLTGLGTPSTTSVTLTETSPGHTHTVS